MRGVVSEALASGKLVHREVFSEGSQTAKSGTDEQKIRLVNKRRRDMRHSYSGKQPHLCNAQRIPKGYLCRSRRDRRKGKAITRGGFGSHVLGTEKSAEVILVGKTSRHR
jgi:hypothetical protein